MIRFNLAMLLGLPATNVVVVNGDIGGSFGQKTGAAPRGARGGGRGAEAAATAVR